MHSLEIGPLVTTFHRTVRVSNNEVSNLPPSLGNFEIFRTKDFKNSPSHWEEDSYFIAMHEREALWMSFQTMKPVAALVGAGGINALSGEKLELKLDNDNYLVCPPQPWLDGWKNDDNCIYQFVCTEYEKGSGKTVGEQMIGEEFKSGGITISVFESEEELKIEAPPGEVFFGGGAFPKNDCKSLMQFASGTAHLEAWYCSDMEGCQEMGVGKGGKIHQKIYPDHHGIEVWKHEPSQTANVYLVNGPQFAEITGRPLPPLPPNFNEYAGTWYGLKDEDKGDIEGTDKFTELEKVAPQENSLDNPGEKN